MLQFAGCVHPSILGLSSTNICPYGLGVKRKCTSEFQDQRILAVIITHATPKGIEWSWMLSLLGKTCQDPPVWLDLSKNESAVLSFRKYGKYFIKKHELSFDVFVQIRFELTYYLFDIHVVLSYEPALSKIFLHGQRVSFVQYSRIRWSSDMV